MEGSLDSVRDPEGRRKFPVVFSCACSHSCARVVFFHNGQVRQCRGCPIQGAECGTKSRLPTTFSTVLSAGGFTHPEEETHFSNLRKGKVWAIGLPPNICRAQGKSINGGLYTLWRLYNGYKNKLKTIN